VRLKRKQKRQNRLFIKTFSGNIYHWTVSGVFISLSENPETVVKSLTSVKKPCSQLLRIWNSLPEDVVSAAHLSLFISRLVRVNLNQFVIGKM